MSLIITSNSEFTETGPANLSSGLNSPEYYTNYLSNTMEIEPNSEIAVQSVKINKEISIEVNRANNQFYVFLGNTTDAIAGAIKNGGDGYDLSFTPYAACYTNVIKGLRSTQDVSTNTLAEELQEALNRGLFHPNMMKSQMNSSGSLVDVKRNGSLLSFDGFEYTFNCGTSASNTDTKAESAFTDSTQRPDQLETIGYDKGTGVIQMNAGLDPDDVGEMIGVGMPISLLGGQFNFDYAAGGGVWEAGLTRYLNTDAISYAEQNPSYLDKNAIDYTYFDWSVASIFDFTDNKFRLRVFHSIRVPGEDTIVPTEFEYWNNGPSSAGPGALTGPIETFSGGSASYSASTISKVEMTVTNEQVKIFVVSSDTSVSYTLADGNQADKADNLKPVGQTTRYLYPKVRITGDGGANQEAITINKFNGVEVEGFVYGDKRNPVGWNFPTENPDIPNDHDWWCKLVNSNREVEGRVIDTRFMFDYSDTSSGLNDDGNYIQQALNGISTLGLNYDKVIITKEDENFVNSNGVTTHYGFGAKGANAQTLMGFDNVPIVGPGGFSAAASPATSVGNIVTYTSANIPQLTSTNSLFVRLDNFNQLSFNAVGTNGAGGTVSKILYHMPRFSNQGTEFGALYFEPHERCYIQLSNSNKIRVNEFQVAFCNSDETLAKSLTGKSIVVFHIRKSQN